MQTGVAVEKLLTREFAKIKSRYLRIRRVTQPIYGGESDAVLPAQSSWPEITI